MSNITYINTQEIRKDLMGFLQELAAGREYVVLNRSKPVVTVSGKGAANMNKAEARRNVQEFLAIGDLARASAKGTAELDPQKSYKELYTETMGKKYGIS